LIYIAAILYSINVIYAIAQLLEMLVRRIQFRFISNCIWILGLMNLARALYFYLLANHVMESAPSWVEILLVELPSFLYLTSFTVIIVLWIGIAHSVRSMKAIPRRIAKILFVLLNILLYAGFIVLVILFEELPNDNSSYCGNRFDNSPSWPPKRIVNLVYRCFIAFVSLSLAISFQVNGFIIYRALAKSDQISLGSKSEHRAHRNTKLKFFWMALVSSIGLFLQSLFLLIIIIIQSTNNTAFIIILIFVEAVPCFLILLMLHNTGPLAAVSTSHSSLEGTSSSGSTGRT